MRLSFLMFRFIFLCSGGCFWWFFMFFVFVACLGTILLGPLSVVAAPRRFLLVRFSFLLLRFGFCWFASVFCCSASVFAGSLQWFAAPLRFLLGRFSFCCSALVSAGSLLICADLVRVCWSVSLLVGPFLFWIYAEPCTPCLERPETWMHSFENKL